MRDANQSENGRVPGNRTELEASLEGGYLENRIKGGLKFHGFCDDSRHDSEERVRAGDVGAGKGWGMCVLLL